MQFSKVGASRALIAAASASLLMGAAFTQTAGAGIRTIAAPLTIVKVVDGVAPAGTTFTATIECSDDIIVVDNDIENETDIATVTFDATGQPTSADVIGFGGPGQCAVTETVNGGATTVAYACTGVQGTPIDDEEPPIKQGFDGASSAAVVLPPVCDTVGADGVEVNISAEDQSGTVTITNTFVTPVAPIQPAAQVVAQPAFTG